MSDQIKTSEKADGRSEANKATDENLPLDALATLDPLVNKDPAATQLPTDSSPAIAFLTPEAIAQSSSHNSRFSIVRFHAKGGLGLLSLATDEELSRTVALKEIQYQYADDGDARARFIREAEITGRLEHPGIVPVYGFGVATDGRPYYAMRFIEGRSLKDAIDEYHSLPTGTSERLLKFRELLRCVIDVCNTIEYAHSRRVIHRDLKPANVMVGAYGETLVVDWGLAKSLDEAEFTPDAKRQVPHSRKHQSESGTETMDGFALGTPQYMSPEQASGKLSKVGPHSDIYSLGATLYHLLAGQPAFLGSDLTKLLSGVIAGTFPEPNVARVDVPGPMSSICLKAMALKPEDRYQSAKELAAEIERWLADEPVDAHGEGFAERWYRRTRRHRSWVMSIATMVPLLLIVMSAAAIFVNSERIEAVKQRDIAIMAKVRESEQRELAQSSERAALIQEQAAKTAAEEAGRSLANLQMINGERAEADGDPSAAALWYHQAMPLIEKYVPHLATPHRIRLSRILGSLPRPLDVRLLPDEIRLTTSFNSISPDGRHLVLTGILGGAAGIDLSKGEMAWPVLPYDQWNPMTSFSDDGKKLITGGAPSGIRVWDVETGQAIGGPMVTQGKINGSARDLQSPFALSEDARFLAVCTLAPDGTNRVERFVLSDAATPRLPLELKEEVMAVRLHPTNNQIMVVTSSHLYFFDFATGEELGEPISQPAIHSARYSPDGQSIAIASNAGYATLWDTESRIQRGGRLDHRGPVREVLFSPQSDTVLTLSADLSSRIWDVATGNPIGNPLDQSDRPIFARYRQDGKAVVTIGRENSVRVWDATTGNLLAGPWRHPSEPDARFLGEQLLIAGRGYWATWDMSRSSQESEIEIRSENRDAKPSRSAHFVGNDERVAIIDDKQVWIIDPEAPEPILRTISCDSAIQEHHLSANGRRLAIRNSTNEFEIWDLEDESQAPNHITPEYPVAHFRLSDDGRRLFTADETGLAHLWNVVTKKVQGGALQHEGKVRDSHFSPDGSMLITGSNDSYLRLWDTETGALLRQPQRLRDEGPAVVVSSVRFHPDGLTIAAASTSNDVIVWQPFRADEPIRHLGSNSPVDLVRFSTDGKVLGVAGVATEVLLWDWRKGGEPVANLPSTDLATIEFAPRTSLIATARLGNVSLWDIQDSRRVGPNWPLTTRSLEIDANERWLLTTAEQTQLWSIRQESRSSEELDDLVQVLALRKIDERGTVVFLSADELASKFMSAKAKHPQDFEPKPGRKIKLPFTQVSIKP